MPCVLEIIRKEFIHGGHLQSLSAAAIVYLSGVLLKFPITWDVLLVSYLIFYPIYQYNRFKEIKTDYLTNPERTNYLKIYHRFVPFIIFFAVSILSACLILFSNLSALTFALLLVFFGFLYTTVFKNWTQKIPFFKNFYVACFFSLLILFSIVYYNFSFQAVPLFTLIAFMGLVWLKVFMIQVFLDVKDARSDREEGLLTFAAVFGERKTINILKIISAAVMVVWLFFASLWLDIFPRSMLLLLFTIPYDFYYFALGQKGNYFAYILAGGEFIIWPLLVFIGEIVL